MGQGKRMRRGARQKVDWDSVMLTLFYSNLSQEEILAMTPKQRRQAQEAGKAMRSSPGYRSWSAESVKEWRAWQDSAGPNKIWDWRLHLQAAGRLDLYRDINRADGLTFFCGKCLAACDTPYAVAAEPRWLCRACAGPGAQPGRFRAAGGSLEMPIFPRRGARYKPRSRAG